MAFEMAFLDQYGANKDATYWRISVFNFDRLSNHAELHFHGYADKEAHDAGKQPIGLHTYTFTGAAYAQMAKILSDTFMKQAYDFAKTTADTPTGDVDPETKKPVLKSFFAEAKDV